ncbi:microfibril-associated glycoprotein 4-like isoform X1 [Drosophila albomicans]|uniref:Microfibril-associated glycoprotein 4-like isoform X1 n=1 Tax=Drosophila albomicans TaxID=7291 RepID=A0A6P8YB31_DROAB|nr:microfibril-associated glycoprotein 4-like isoform X1 [Drosophila albomicans]
MFSKYILLLFLAFAIKKSFCESFCHNTKKLDSECASYCYEACKPLLQMAPECYRKDAEIAKLKDQVAELRKQIAIQEAKDSLCISQRSVVSEIKALFDKCSMPDKMKDTTPKLKAETILKETKVTELTQFKSKFNESISYPDNCEQSTGIKTIQVAGILRPFQVFCDNITNDFPWIVMQRRVGRTVDFNNYWYNYANGFGDINGSYFIGLEKVFRLTYTQPYELYIHLEAFDGTIGHARYNHFLISRETGQYRLSQLGNFTGDVYDAMSDYLNAKFFTFNNDSRDRCATKMSSAWWYKSCDISSNLNGRYSDFEINNAFGIWWKNFSGGRTLKSVKMLIRPAH